MSDLSAALTAYRAAVRATAIAERTGRHGDGKPEAAAKAERAARARVMRAAGGAR